VASSTGAGVAAASRAGSAIADARGTQHAADAPLTAGAAVPSFAPGSEAGMTGQHHPNGESRPSHEFMRFAAVLKQVAPAADEGGHAPVAAATPSAAPAQAPAAAVLSPAPSSAATETPGADNVGRLVQAMRVIARPGAWEANVRLNPEHLGDVSIAVRVERNAVTAVVNAESAGVCEWLESQEQAVRNGMAEHGLQLDRFVVQRDGQRREAPEQEQQQGRRARRGRQAATTERFEIVV
jgi:flagellar hook-length control protein FliK